MTNEEFQKIILEELRSLSDRLGNVEGQLSETNQIVKALIHRTDELDAKHDSLLHNTVTKDAIAGIATQESVARIEAKLDVIAHRLFEQETDIQLLKRAK